MRKSNGEKELESVLIYAERVKILEKEIEDRREDAEALGAVVIDGLPKGSGTGDLSGKVATIADLTTRLEKLKEEATIQRLQVVIRITNIKNKAYMRFLYARYVNGLTLQEIENEVGFSESWVRKNHMQAVRLYDQTYFGNKKEG